MRTTRLDSVEANWASYKDANQIINQGHQSRTLIKNLKPEKQTREVNREDPENQTRIKAECFCPLADLILINSILLAKEIYKLYKVLCSL